MLTKKERAVLRLLKDTGKISKIKLVKLMFLISGKARFYSFVPYHYGPFSFELYRDLSRLEREGYISMDGESVALVNKDIPPLDRKSESAVMECSQKFLNCDENQIIRYTYDNYPEYTIFSLRDRRLPYKRDGAGIVTMGYEGKSIDSFLYELILNKVSVVIDVRRNAYSMKFGFYKDKLTDYLGKLGIEYVHMPELGIPSEFRKKLINREDYEVLFADYEKELENKTEFLERIKTTAKEKKVALMCFEKDADYCHRGVIAERLRKEGVGVSDL